MQRCSSDSGTIAGPRDAYHDVICCGNHIRIHPHSPLLVPSLAALQEPTPPETLASLDIARARKSSAEGRLAMLQAISGNFKGVKKAATSIQCSSDNTSQSLYCR